MYSTSAILKRHMRKKHGEVCEKFNKLSIKTDDFPISGTEKQTEERKAKKTWAKKGKGKYEPRLKKFEPVLKRYPEPVLKN